MLVGTETQTQEHQLALTGIQRVICETHKVLLDSLGAQGIDIGWINTRQAPRSMNFMSLPYLANDPVLTGRGARLEDIDLLLLLDIPAHMDFRTVNEERKRRELPVIALIYDILPLTHPEWFPERASRDFKLYIQQLFYITDYIVVNSHQVKRDLENLGWKRAADITVIPLGSIFAQKNHSRLPENQISMLYVSTFAPRKGHETLLDSFDELRVLGIDVDLTLIGQEGWKCAELADRIRNHPDYCGRLKWLKNADDHAVETAAARCNIGVIPAEGEGFGLFLEEGLTLGLNMVASDISVFREREYPNVTYFDGLNSTNMTRAILEAAGKEWTALVPGDVRAITQFGLELSDFVIKVLNRENTNEIQGEVK